ARYGESHGQGQASREAPIVSSSPVRSASSVARGNFQPRVDAPSPFPLPGPLDRRAYPRRLLRGGGDLPHRPRRRRDPARRGGPAAAGPLGGGDGHAARGPGRRERNGGRQGGPRRG